VLVVLAPGGRHLRATAHGPRGAMVGRHHHLRARVGLAPRRHREHPLAVGARHGLAHHHAIGEAARGGPIRAFAVGMTRRD